MKRKRKKLLVPVENLTLTVTSSGDPDLYAETCDVLADIFFEWCEKKDKGEAKSDTASGPSQ